METVQQNGRFTLFSSKFLSIYSILYWIHLFENRGQTSNKTVIQWPKRAPSETCERGGGAGTFKTPAYSAYGNKRLSIKGVQGGGALRIFLMELALKVSGRGEICYLIFDFYTFYKHLYLERISCTARNLFFKSIFGKQN